jgi:uncharacterized protein with HEPN domain
MRSDRERLLDILDAIEKIEQYAAGGKEAFDSEELLQVWVTDLSEVQIFSRLPTR